MALLPGITDFNSKLTPKELRQLQSTMSKASRRIAKSLGIELQTPEKFSDGLHTTWLRDHVEGEILREVVSEYLQRPFQSQAYVDLRELASDEVDLSDGQAPSLDKLLSLIHI